MGAIERVGNDPPRTGSTTVSIGTENVPEIRKNRARRASIAIFSITATLVLIFCFISGKVVEYHPDTSSSSTQKNTTRICLRKEKYAFPSLFTTALGLLSVVLGTLVDRFSLVFEERHHLKERYGGSRRKMIKACFSGIQKGPVIFLSIITLVIVVLLILLTGMPYFEVRYLVTIFSGIGVGPLVMHLLNLNTQSEVHISTIMEERETYVANGLAWSYYFSYLKQALPKFKEMINSSPGILSLNKLLLLVPLDCHVNENLNELDQNIEERHVIGSHQDAFRFPVYRLKVNESEYHHFAIQYVKEPLLNLHKMSTSADIRAVTKQSREAEVKLLCRTLSQIIEDPPNQRCRETCILVPIKTKKLDSLKNGGLVEAIMKAIKSQPKITSQRTDTDGASQSGCRILKIVSACEEEKLIVDLDSSCKSNKASNKITQGVKTQSSDVTTYNDQRRDGENMNLDFDDNSTQKGKSLKRKYKGKTPEETELQQMVPKEHTLSHPFNTSHEKANDDQRKVVQEVGEGNDEGASTSGHNSQMDFTVNGDQPTDQDEGFSNDEEYKRLSTSQL